MSNVAYALKEYAKQSPAGAWTLAFGLEHKYTKASLSTLGVRDLKGADRCSVAAFSEASQQIGIGDVNVVLCKLSRTVCESGDVWNGRFQKIDTDEGEIFAEVKFDADGNVVKDDLNFIT
ncbi:hypothetical protein BWQ96_03290 [Gracilariopsis chorda]|uniref:Uncharacterized protein n=1 Tax=Gracilariopsis chorda TaxID=448386 RepID=A0A2V3IXT0_9FLOR|nr:hypothetical protein BWQ96_03290 [Gracilariopsis chorda]|eukprot:PXF46952.1 hypothetical protein BWQ96_03290 [Gracilariopsis chorda]